MSDFDWNDDTDNNDLVKRLRKEIEKRDAALKERDSEFGKLQEQVRHQSVSSILRDMGVKPKVANLIPKEIDADPDAIKKWVSDYEDVFGSAKLSEEKPANSAEATESQETAQSAPEGTASLDPETAAAWARMQTAENSTGQVPTGEDAQLAWLSNAAAKSGDNADQFFAYLRGEKQP